MEYFGTIRTSAEKPGVSELDGQNWRWYRWVVENRLLKSQGPFWTGTLWFRFKAKVSPSPFLSPAAAAAPCRGPRERKRRKDRKDKKGKKGKKDSRRARQVSHCGGTRIVLGKEFKKRAVSEF